MPKENESKQAPKIGPSAQATRVVVGQGRMLADLMYIKRRLQMSDEELDQVTRALWCCYSIGFSEANLGIATAAGKLAADAAHDAEASAVYSKPKT